MGKLFGTDGIRGIANSELTPELLFKIGRAHAHSLKAHNPRPRILVGRDTRISGDLLEAAYTAGACASGADVVSVGVLPTPGVAVLIPLLQGDSGAVLSASHNPVQDNGIKLLSRDGFKLEDAVEAEIERLIDQADQLPRPTGAEVGRRLEESRAEDLYLAHLMKASRGRLEGLKVVLDCAHGAAYHVAPRLFRELGARVEVIAASPDGTNINVKCGSTHLEGLQAEVVARQAHLGLAFDGDADRCLAVDEQGAVVDGDQMMALFANWLKTQGRLCHDLVVATVMSNVGLEIALREKGIRLLRTRVGDRYVLEEMKSKSAVLGGEQSGHLIMLEHGTTGDGTLAALMLATLVHESSQPLSALAAGMPRLPQKLVNVRARHKDKLDSDEEIGAAITRLEGRLAERGRILVRCSGTEPLVRVMAEGPDLAELDDVVGELSRLIEQRLG